MVFSELRWGLAVGVEHSFARLQISHMGQSVRSPLIRRHAAESKSSTDVTHKHTRMRTKKTHYDRSLLHICTIFFLTILIYVRIHWSPSACATHCCRMWSGCHRQPLSAEISGLHLIRNRTLWPLSHAAFLPFHFMSPIPCSDFIYLHGDKKK